MAKAEHWLLLLCVMKQQTDGKRHFSEELDNLTQRLIAMARLVEDRMRLAIRALIERDRDLPRTVIEGDEDVDRLHAEIDGQCFTLLALYQPAAVDLRSILAAVQISCDLERIGDLAVNIAEATQRYISHPPVMTLADIPQMAGLAQAMLNDALNAFVSHDLAAAQSVLDRDDILDDLRTRVVRDLLRRMVGDTRTIEAGLNLVLVSQHLERVGDHATNIAEEVIFIVAARDVRHHAASRA